MSLSVDQQRALNTGITQAQGTTTVGGATVTRSEAADIVSGLVHDGVSSADVRAALASPDIDRTTRAAFEAALASQGTGVPREFTKASKAAADRSLNVAASQGFPFLDSVPDEVSAEGFAQLQRQQSQVIDGARTGLRDGAAALSRGDYAAAQAAYASIGLPVGSDIDPEDVSPECRAALVLMGVYRLESDGTIAPRPGANPDRAPEFRAVNGMAARVELLGEMARLGGSPSNPPTEADVSIYLAAAASEHQGDPEALMEAVGRVENGLLLHYRASDNNRDISYDNGYPTSWANIEAQDEVGGRRRADCQLEAMVWFEGARMAGLTPVAMIAVEPSRAGGIGHAMAAVEAPGGKLYLCSGDQFIEIPPSRGGLEARIDDAVKRFFNATFGHAPGAITVGFGDTIETASEAAYK